MFALGNWPNRFVLGNGRFGVRPDEFASIGPLDGPLENDPGGGDALSEFAWVINSLPASGVVIANDDGGFSHTGAADGTYITTYQLWAWPVGGPLSNRGTGNITTTFGVTIISGETDSAFALSARQIKVVGLATETDSAFALAGLQIKAVGLATETDSTLAPIAGVSFQSLSNSGFMGAIADYTFARTLSGDSRFLVVDVAVLSAGSNVLSVTDDSGVTNAPFTLIGSRATDTGSGLIESWGRIAPATGTKNIRVVLSSAVSTAASAANYTGVNQTTPTEALNSNVGTNGGAATDATVNITPIAAGAWVHAALATNDNSCSSADRRDSIADMIGGSIETMDTRGVVSAAAAREMRVTGLGATAAWTILGFAIRPIAATASGAPAGIATQTDSALALAGVHRRPVGLAAETDSALALSAPGQIFALETDTAFALAGVHLRATGLSSETDSAFALSAVQARAVGLATETGTAFALAAVQRLIVGVSAETDTALARPAGSTGGGANPADVWNYVMANGQTAEMNLLALLECCQKMMKIQTNKRITDPVAGTETLFDNDNLTVLLQGALFEDAAGVQRYRGQGAERRDRMV